LMRCLLRNVIFIYKRTKMAFLPFRGRKGRFFEEKKVFILGKGANMSLLTEKERETEGSPIGKGRKGKVFLKGISEKTGDAAIDAGLGWGWGGVLVISFQKTKATTDQIL